MKRHELEHVIRAACAILNVRELRVIGSQAIHAVVNESELPAEAALSLEANIFTFPGWDEDAERLIESALGESSRFAQTFGYYADAVSENTPWRRG